MESGHLGGVLHPEYALPVSGSAGVNTRIAVSPDSESCSSSEDFSIVSWRVCRPCYHVVHRKLALSASEDHLQETNSGTASSRPSVHVPDTLEQIAIEYIRPEDPVSSSFEELAVEGGKSRTWNVPIHRDRILRKCCHEVCQRLVCTLDLTEFLIPLYRNYVERVRDSQENLSPCSISTMQRILSDPESPVILCDYRAEGLGAMILTPSTLCRMTKRHVERQLEDSLNITPDEIRACINCVADVYLSGPMKERFQHGEWSVVEEIGRFDPRWWRAVFLTVESRREKVERLALEKTSIGNTDALMLPSWSGNISSESDLNTLTSSTYQKTMRVFTILQQHVMATRQSPGPLTWSVSISALIFGSKPIVTLLYGLVVSFSYRSLHRLRTRIAADALKRSSSEKVNTLLFGKYAWDNIDSRLAGNVFKAVGKSTGFHGTVMVCQQQSDTPAIVCSESMRAVTRSRFPTPESFVQVSLQNSTVVRDSGIVVMSLVAAFGSNLISMNPSKSVSLDRLLRVSLQGTACGVPAEIAHLVFTDAPSNSATTAALMLGEVLSVTKDHSRKASDQEGTTRYSLVSGDQPLYAQMMKLVLDTADGSWNPSYNGIIPFPGMMHQHMALQDAVKYCAYDSCLDALAVSSGLSSGAIETFRGKKDFKTNVRFLRQCLCSLTIRVINVLFEDGTLDLDEDILSGLDVSPVAAVRDESTPSIASNKERVATLAQSKGPVPPGFSLNMSPSFYGMGMYRIGVRMFDEIEKQSCTAEDPNFAFFGRELLLMLLCPVVGMYYVSGADQLRIRQGIIRQFSPYIFTTRKTVYMQNSICQMQVDGMLPDLQKL